MKPTLLFSLSIALLACGDDSAPVPLDGGRDGGEGTDAFVPDAGSSDAGPSDAPPPPVCGDGRTDEGEICDDGNTTDGDGCDTTCTFSCAEDADCIDSITCDGAETCNGTTHVCVDAADLVDGSDCDADSDPATRDICIAATCIASTCGDAFTDPGAPEDCDDANTTDGDGCDGDCTFSCATDPECADTNACNGAETCDTTTHVCVDPADLADGALCDADSDPGTRDICLAVACVASTCGDGFTDSGASEDCDDANPTNGDGCDDDCTFSCTADRMCADTNACNGAETCDTTAHVCVNPADLADGSACDADSDPGTRDICLASACGASRCGDGYVDAVDGEDCEDGNTMDGDGCEADCTFTPTAFRVTTIAIAEPHLYFDSGTCDDETAPFNGAFQSNIDMLAVNVILLFRPLDAAAGSTAAEIVFGECMAGPTRPTCQLGAGTSTATVATNASSGSCYAPDPATLNPMYAAPNSVDAPCFATAPRTMTLPLGPIILPTMEARAAATYSGGSPPTTLISGVLAAFITEADAIATMVGPGVSLYSILAAGGATGSSCSTEDDRDTFMGVTGFWLYVNFTAQRVDWMEP